MGMNMTEKILARHAGLESVSAGQLIFCKLDMVLANDVTAPPAIKEFEKIGKPVFDNTKIALVPDHFTPNKDIKAAGLAKTVREFARKHQIKNYFEIGRVGIEHVILPEKGIVGPGMLTIGADSHTCTYGAVNGFSTGVGSTDLGVAMATGEAWFKVPKAIKVVLTGKKPKYICGKDVILTLIGMIGVDGALYKAIEFAGEGVAELTMTDRLTISNMAIEAGGKNGIFPFDEITREYVEGRVQQPYEPVAADEDAEYEQVVEIDLSKLTPVVAFPHLPGNTHPVSEIGEIKIDQVVIGSCTNGRLEDLQQAAEILAGHTVHPDVRCIIIPGSQQVYLDAMKAGYVETFINAGAAVSTPTCGPCLGAHMGIMAAGEKAVSTTNRNFRGRMGHVDSEVYLAGPYVAAASAILGRIAVPEEVK
ncbi:3-isopropylmalate dehydratase large subunit [Anaerovibrio slackiae]|uniref:3-isopropylmalate dehydratase large subunit n=4 Tax=Anaerovibrio slackiae TaxID=2652309 RepID=A0A6I2UH58_9FIRM|nr:3-isopropylmalate dehydratase large subunit [Anaerovibrio slackiae]MBQ2410601.1 3-isopropylmalate dehydratase large subunit [Selenomonadaceae bacterium]MBQ5732024.1 3-isopropylmalate dehydratase large subunit [Selenomonadaceae bacterium]MBQ5822241.1 3-isopropylmalate dehydratase large subunit [Selenomonadaceae bacterium]MBR0328169.1 3-isopropylmalate dehydratase large subunit [Selenomonadaceae bacterium]MCI6484141.1 3-isopropylmalate dehydratase large subunit [Selenomonadaceae bacterium]